MISTLHPNLPAPADLQRLCKALAVLDAINSPDWEYRYYSYNPAWSDDEQLLEMRDGEGDQMLVLFHPAGCVINGYLHEYDQPDKAALTRGLPAALAGFMFEEPVNSIGTTFCLWYTPAHGWQHGTGVSEDDGSEELLYIFDNKPATYAEWATEYYTDESDKKPVTAAAVAPIYRQEPVTKANALALVDEVDDWTLLATDLQEIGYPYEFS